MLVNIKINGKNYVEDSSLTILKACKKNGIHIPTLCYLFQNVGQKFVNENIAALLLSLESVFGVFFSILFGQEIMTLQIGLGFMIIFISVLISETKLSFLHRGGKQ